MGVGVAVGVTVGVAVGTGVAVGAGVSLGGGGTVAVGAATGAQAERMSITITSKITALLIETVLLRRLCRPTIWVSCRCGAGKEHFLTYLFRWRGTRTLRCEAAVGFTHMLAASVNVRV
jgi:hypothetical protein